MGKYVVSPATHQTDCGRFRASFSVHRSQGNGSYCRVFRFDKAFASREEAFDGETITYKHRDKHSVVVSGTKGDSTFYRKSILACRNQVWDSVSIEYPAAQKKAFDAIVSHVASSLKAGQSEQVAECNR